jgi:hypothetical protein
MFFSFSLPLRYILFRLALPNTILHWFSLIAGVIFYFHVRLHRSDFDCLDRLVMTETNDFWSSRLCRYCEGMILYSAGCLASPLIKFILMIDENTYLIGSNLKVGFPGIHMSVLSFDCRVREILMFSSFLCFSLTFPAHSFIVTLDCP